MKAISLVSLSALVAVALPFVALGCGFMVVDTVAASADAAPVDSGKVDAAKVDAAGAVDAAAPAVDAGQPEPDASGCVPGPSISDASVPDAALTNDGGSAAMCASCVATACPAEVADCDAECECNVAANELFTCLGSGQSAFACAQQIGQSSSPALQNLGQCVLGAQECRQPCGIVGFP